ncbi:MAG: helix-turn-helix transcriptional regulator [Clostridiales bacterium]|uniref:helix-turn-helix domain-containing protein n=1 Tax=Enterocloster sp. TaxID=2719315 RepID=UPI0015B60380|nr:helix-turn-helix transcriptional regulator [Clostridiales bacterium]
MDSQIHAILWVIMMKGVRKAMEQLHYNYSRKNINIETDQSVYRIGSYHYNWHQDLEFLLVLKGEIEVCSENVNRILQEDDLILINSNSGHATFSRESGSIAMVLHVNPAFLKDYYEDAEYLHFQLCSDPATRQGEIFRLMRKNLADMMFGARGENSQQKLLFDHSFYNLMHLLISEFPPKRIQSAAFHLSQKKLDAIDRMIRYINRNYCRRIGLDMLAKESGYNPSYVSQLFKTYLGINFYDYLTRIRLREATRALSRSDAKILDIAMEHGFADLKSFNAAFKESFHKSPTEYRRQLSADHALSDLEFKKTFISADDPYVCRKLEQYREKKERESCGSHMGPACDAAREHILRLHQLAGEFISEADKLSREIDSWETER